MLRVWAYESPIGFKSLSSISLSLSLLAQACSQSEQVICGVHFASPCLMTTLSPIPTENTFHTRRLSVFYASGLEKWGMLRRLSRTSQLLSSLSHRGVLK